jgi:hypothetical protein
MSTAKALAALAKHRHTGPASQRRSADCRYRRCWRLLRAAGMTLDGSKMDWGSCYRFLRAKHCYALRFHHWHHRLVKPLCWRRGMQLWARKTNLLARLEKPYDAPSSSILMPTISRLTG